MTQFQANQSPRMLSPKLRTWTGLQEQIVGRLCGEYGEYGVPECQVKFEGVVTTGAQAAFKCFPVRALDSSR